MEIGDAVVDRVRARPRALFPSLCSVVGTDPPAGSSLRSARTTGLQISDDVASGASSTTTGDAVP